MSFRFGAGITLRSHCSMHVSVRPPTEKNECTEINQSTWVSRLVNVAIQLTTGGFK